MNPWPQSFCAAVSLTYDDGIPSHHQSVAPALERHGLRGTFYVPAKKLVDADIEAWRRVAAAGHELGNHSCFHPCRRDEKRHPWLVGHYDLRFYTLDRLRDEWKVANLILRLIDGKTERTYGNTCCDTTFGNGEEETSMDPLIDELFLAGRGSVTSQVAMPGPGLKFAQLGHFSGDSKTFEELREEVERARATGGWTIYMFHGVGKENHPLHIDPAEHDLFISWLGQQNDLWTAPLAEVARHLRQ